jgi:hypothetical protein
MNVTRTLTTAAALLLAAIATAQADETTNALYGWANVSIYHSSCGRTVPLPIIKLGEAYSNLPLHAKEFSVQFAVVWREKQQLGNETFCATMKSSLEPLFPDQLVKAKQAGFDDTPPPSLSPAAAEPIRGVTKIVKLLLHRVADKDQRLHFEVLSLPLGVGNDLTNLSESGAAVDTLHQPGQVLRLRHPSRGLTFAVAAVVDQLHVEAADRRGFPEHVGLQLAGSVPSGLTACRGVEGKNQTPPRAGHDGRRSTNPFQERVDCAALIGGQRRNAGIVVRHIQAPFVEERVSD